MKAFFPGLHQPSDAQHMPRACISVNRLRDRVGDFSVGDWIMDSGAFTTVNQFGYYPDGVDEYAKQIRRWRDCGNLLTAVAQDFMCEDEVLIKTGLHDVFHHQNFTVTRYEDLLAEDAGGVYIMPVLQGRTMGDYLRHIDQYERRGHLPVGAWVGVGSVCKRNGDPMRLWMILAAIHDRRPDLLLHGFGVKTTSLAWQPVHSLLHTADSMAWSFAGRMQRGNGNDWRDAQAFAAKMDALTGQHSDIPSPVPYQPRARQLHLFGERA